MKQTRHSRWPLTATLLALAALYLYWFHDDRHRTAALLVFALPPLLLAAALRRATRAKTWAGILALFWFSHGVMSAWSHADTRALALCEIVLALLVVAASSWQGLQARFSRARPPH